MNVQRNLLRLVDVRPNEISALAWSFFYFFLLLCSYYIIRPIRTEMIIVSGIDQVHWLALGVFLSMLLIVPVFGWMTRNLTFLNTVYLFFSFNLILFYLIFRAGEVTPLIARSFYVWVGVFNLFVVSVFWSFMSEVYKPGQARRLFGLIAAGGSFGAIFGPLMTRQLVPVIGLAYMPLVAALLLGVATLCLRRLIAYSQEYRSKQLVAADQAMGGSPFAGARLILQHKFLAKFAGFMILGTFTGSMLYVFQSTIIKDNYSDIEQIATIFANIDLLINVLATLVNLFVTARLIRWFGLAAPIAMLPLFTTLTFGLMAVLPLFSVIIGSQVVRRVTLFAVTNPTSHSLFTIVGPQSRYKFKHFLDTVVYRAGDTLGSWAFNGAAIIGMGVIAPTIFAGLMAFLWIILSLALVREFRQMQKQGNKLP